MLEKVKERTNMSPLISPAHIIAIYTWEGILSEQSETKSIIDCELNYMTAMLSLHKLYGDPRGRG